MKLPTLLASLLCLFMGCATEIHGEVETKRYNKILHTAWSAYKDRYIQKDGRVADPAKQGITTSESQSYGMLRAVWSEDRPTFDRVWQWTRNNLKRDEDKLFAWQWGQRPDGSWGILKTDAASDADEDIAYALILASEKWKTPEFATQSKEILQDIWAKEVALTADDKPVMGPGPGAVAAAGKDRPVELNPSYFVPYEYRKFAQIDPEHNWNGLVDHSYELLESLTKLSRLELPPDWCVLDRKTGELSIDRESQRSDFSYDAIRIPWRIAADYTWYQDPRAERLLRRMSFLLDTWKVTRTIRGAYTATGVMRTLDEPLCALGCCLPMFGILAPESAEELAQEKLQAVYQKGVWLPENDYYGNNWAWFGIALYSDYLPKPAKSAKQ